MVFYTRKRRMPAVIIVSLIDILAILLIFVIVTTTFRRDQPQVVIKLPESKSAAPAPATSSPAVLTVKSEDKIFLEEKPLAFEDLKAALQSIVRATPDRPIALNADTTAPFGLVVKILDVLKESGVKSNVSAFTEPPK
ncbi:MAG: biopolymer transporter ExbD [Verrucomicrobiota bacterium]|nr:biopolymer transporter ExbD [Verrucomicrobiota bacterium]